MPALISGWSSAISIVIMLWTVTQILYCLQRYLSTKWGMFVPIELVIIPRMHNFLFCFGVFLNLFLNLIEQDFYFFSFIVRML